MKKESSWYKSLFPSIQQCSREIFPLAKKLHQIDGVQQVYLWGQAAKNILNKTAKIKNIDIVVKVSMSSQDMISIVDEANKMMKQSQLQYLGIDKKSYNFTKKFIDSMPSCVQKWAISKDGVLMHFGAIPENGWTQGMAAADMQNDSFIDSFSRAAPSGWYQLKYNVKSIQKQFKKI